jgi:cysteine desulfurase family protein (TIGR01976 family)
VTETNAFPIDAVRAQFPALADSRTVFFDNPGGTQIPETVIAAVSDYYRTRCANVGGAFATSQRTDETIRQAREAMADLLGAPDPDTIVFGASMTALTFHIARSFAETCRPGDEVIVTDLDHDANIAPWRDLEAVGVTVRVVPFHTADGTLDTDAYAAALRPGRTRLVALNYASNALGTITDLAPLVRQAHDAGALVYVDSVQSVPHLPTDVAALDCDFLACSAYKFFGPHVGVLYGKREPLECLTPHKVRPAKNTIPHRWEQGTLNHEGLAGVAAAVGYLERLADAGGTRRERLYCAMAAIQAYEQTLSTRLLTGLTRLPDITVYGLSDPARVAGRVPTVAFTRRGESPRAICERLAAAGIHAWSGNYYAVRIMESLGLEANGGAVRVGLAHYNTTAEIDRLLNVLDAV